MLIFEVGQHSHVVNKVGHTRSSLEMSPSCHLLHLSQLLSLQSSPFPPLASYLGCHAEDPGVLRAVPHSPGW